MSTFTVNGKPVGYYKEVVETASDNYAKWMLVKQRELDEATTLLERFMRGEHGLGRDVTAFLAARAPAQPAAPREPTIGPDARHSVRPAAPTPDIRTCLSCGRIFGNGGSCKSCQAFEPAAPTPVPNCGKHHGVRYLDCYDCQRLPGAPEGHPSHGPFAAKQPAAPEPSAESWEPLARWQARAESAEAQLASALKRIDDAMYWLSKGSATRDSTIIFEAAAALTPAPEPWRWRENMSQYNWEIWPAEESCDGGYRWELTRDGQTVAKNWCRTRREASHECLDELRRHYQGPGAGD